MPHGTGLKKKFLRGLKGGRQIASGSGFFRAVGKIVPSGPAAGWMDEFPAPLPGRKRTGRATGGGAKLAPGLSATMR